MGKQSGPAAAAAAVAERRFRFEQGWEGDMRLGGGGLAIGVAVGRQWRLDAMLADACGGGGGVGGGRGANNPYGQTVGGGSETMQLPVSPEPYEYFTAGIHNKKRARLEL